MQKNSEGIFTISLDFELYWGMRDKTTIEGYADNLNGVEDVSASLLEVFGAYGVHATWATVGFMFYDDIDDLNRNLPLKKPDYKDREINPYEYIEGNNHLEKKYHFVPKIIKSIADDENQEIATHTFSHYYCLEDGQSKDDFRSDITQAIDTIKEKTGKETYSLVFPRNQWNEDYFPILSDLGLQSYRGNEKYWIYNAPNEEENIKPKRRAIRLMDAYINISGHNTYPLSELVTDGLLNIPASRYLRPVSKTLSFLEGIRLKRIKNAMSHAAKNGELFHLWWHPHDFGANIEANIMFLTKVLEHYKVLEKEYGMKALNMKEVAQLLRDKNEK